MQSDLALLVDTEARLDRDLAAARAKVAALEHAANERMAEADVGFAAQLEAERIRIATDSERETAQRIREIEDAARVAVARFTAIRDDRADAIARRIVEQLIALAEDSS
jgi:hypothetical protein